MKLTIICLIALLAVTAFIGCQPTARYKDKTIERVTTFFNQTKEKVEAKLEQIEREKEERRIVKREAEENRLSSLGISNPSKVAKEIDTNKELRIGLEVLEIVNAIRKERGTSKLLWDAKLYGYSLTHSKNMAKEDRMFHSDMNLPYGENAWWGGGSSWRAKDIVESWMTSPKHRTWLLSPNLERVAVGVVYSSNGMYASWTFWRSETQHSDWWYQYTPNNPPKWWY